MLSITPISDCRADRSGARFAAIIGDQELASNEATLRDLASGEQDRIPMESLIARVRP